MLSHRRGHARPAPVPACPVCRGPVELGSAEMLLSTNRGYRFPRVVVQWCRPCGQTIAIELADYPRCCRCDAHLETDVVDHGPVPCERQLVSVVFESCAACGQVREVYLNH